MHPLGRNILLGCCGARAQPALPRGLPLLLPSLPPHCLPARVLPFPTFPFLWGQAGVRIWEILPPPASWPCRLRAIHPGWEPKPHCSLVPFLASLLQQLMLCRGVQAGTGGVYPRGRAEGEQDAWKKCAHHVAHSPGVQLGPPLHLCSHRPPCKMGNSSNNFELRQLLLLFL